MKELSLNILDVAENSVKAGADLTEIIIDETAQELTLTIRDNGCGMSDEVERAVTNPFYTTRTTRKVGLGVPLLKLAAEQCGGSLTIESKTSLESPTKHGTTLVATFNKEHIDFTPLGDVVSTIQTLIQGHPEIDFLFVHSIGTERVTLDTREMREVLGDLPLNSYEVILWVREALLEQYAQIGKS
ncbi:MAG: sensor histidine kinase [Clostridia bacterium]|nr:sensor histidine kinase [Clostridia bacterium]